MTEPKRTFGGSPWCVEDLETLRPDWTVEQLEAFVDTNLKYFQDRITELGWDVWDTLMSFDGDA